MTIDNSYDFILQEAHKCKTCSIQEMNLIGILLDGLNLQGEKCFNPIRNFSWNYKIWLIPIDYKLQNNLLSYFHKDFKSSLELPSQME